MIAAFIWIWPAIVIRILASHFDNLTQNFYRFFAAAIVLIIINLVWYRAEFFKEFGNIKKFVFPTVLLFLFQIIWVMGLSILTPTVAVLISKSNVLFVTVFSFLLFKDERVIIKSRAFILGLSLATIGVIGVIMGRNALHLQDFNLGVLLMLTGAVLWALYLMVVKTRVRKTEPLVVAGIIYTLSIPLFFISSLIWGNLSKIFAASLGINTLLFASGILAVGIANAFNFKSIKLIGTAISSTFVLVTPFFTGIASYFIFKEVLTIPQILSGIILIIGCAILLRAGNNSRISEANLKGGKTHG